MSTQAQIFPSLRYADADAGIDWIERVMGFARGPIYREEGTVVHAELWLGDVGVMLGSVGQGNQQTFDDRAGKASLYIAREDFRASWEHAVKEGAEVEMELQDMGYGWGYSLRDPEGNIWSVGDYAGTKEPNGL